MIAALRRPLTIAATVSVALVLGACTQTSTPTPATPTTTISDPGTVRQAAVPAGETTRIASHHRIRRDCSVVIPAISVTAPPQNGTITTRVTETVIDESHGGDGSCLGRPLQVREVLYTPNRGFTGSDRVSYFRDSGGDRHSGTFTWQITVQ